MACRPAFTICTAWAPVSAPSAARGPNEQMPEPIGSQPRERARRERGLAAARRRSPVRTLDARPPVVPVGRVRPHRTRLPGSIVDHYARILNEISDAITTDSVQVSAFLGSKTTTLSDHYRPRGPGRGALVRSPAWCSSAFQSASSVLAAIASRSWARWALAAGKAHGRPAVSSLVRGEDSQAERHMSECERSSQDLEPPRRPADSQARLRVLVDAVEPGPDRIRGSGCWSRGSAAPCPRRRDRPRHQLDQAARRGGRGRPGRGDRAAAHDHASRRGRRPPAAPAADAIARVRNCLTDYRRELEAAGAVNSPSGRARSGMRRTAKRSSARSSGATGSRPASSPERMRPAHVPRGHRRPAPPRGDADRGHRRRFD